MGRRRKTTSVPPTGPWEVSLNLSFQGRLAFEARLPETEKIQLSLVCCEGETAAGERGRGVRRGVCVSFPQPLAGVLEPGTRLSVYGMERALD